MRNWTVAFGSFVFGVLVAGLLGSFNPHTSTVRQFLGEPVFAQTTPQRPPVKPSRYVPTFPPIGVQSSGNVVHGFWVDVDGVFSDGETFENVTLKYGGGAYLFRNAIFRGQTKIELIGAAANTAQFMATFGMIGCPASIPKAPPHIEMNTPRIDKVDLVEPMKGDFQTPYGGTQ